MVFPPAWMSVLAWTSGVIFTSPAEVEKVCVWAKAVSEALRVSSSIVFMQDMVRGKGESVKGNGSAEARIEPSSLKQNQWRINSQDHERRELRGGFTRAEP